MPRGVAPSGPSSHAHRPFTVTPRSLFSGATGPLDCNGNRLLPFRTAERPDLRHTDFRITAGVDHLDAVDVVLGKKGESRAALRRRHRIASGLESEFRLSLEPHTGTEASSNGANAPRVTSPSSLAAGTMAGAGGNSTSIRRIVRRSSHNRPQSTSGLGLSHWVSTGLSAAPLR